MAWRVGDSVARFVQHRALNSMEFCNARVRNGDTQNVNAAETFSRELSDAFTDAERAKTVASNPTMGIAAAVDKALSRCWRSLTRPTRVSTRQP
eukprot:CAMPEP_0183361134 /NCGR_PEP_ID=MMETSP0164_2-20130417/56934_1 /TAXON_ID=221442 /ORGANISM="Coccolithus pelagicus ssp braarudi, Strain PLY182g" /LENGTH=93 /DNA_ID=CAMNT_0025535615 /DNA_START=59 /DNA_END=335 /DNA_ORIENTATION=-